MAVDDEGRAGPALGPDGRPGGVGAFAGLAGGIDDLDARDDVGMLALPGRAGEEAAVHEDGVEILLEVGEGHRGEKLPVGGAQCGDGGAVLGSQQRVVAFAAGAEQAQLVVAEQAAGAGGAGKIDHEARVGTAVDEVAEEDEAVATPERQLVEEFGEFGGAAVNVADGDEASCAQTGFVLASRPGRSKQISMELILQPSSTQCAVTGTAFQEGDRVVSFLGQDATGNVARWDMLATAEAQFQAPEHEICRWVHVFKPREKEENHERNLKLGAESLFTTLCDPAVELSEANVPLVQFLVLMLERKKLLRPKGLTADRARRIYEHAKTKQLYEVPVGELTPEFFVKVQQQLGVLVGVPKKKVEPAPAKDAAVTPAESAPAAVPAVPAPATDSSPEIPATPPPAE